MKNAIFQYFLDYNGVGKCKHYRDEVGLPEWGQYSVSYFEKYAEMHGADHFFLTDRFVESTSNYFEITRVFKDPMFDEYDKVLYLDIDVMPKTMYASIFDIDVTDIAGVPEWKHPEYIGTPKWSARGPLAQRFRDFGTKIVPSESTPAEVRMINTGVVLWSREARLKARELFDDHEKWFHHKNALLDPKLNSKIVGHSSQCLDQPYLNAMWNKYNFDVKELDNIWNRFPTKDEDHFCHFAHYTQDSRYKIPEIFKYEN
jgi:lipopolysaccharide biosynthesis glycosyltransferase